MTIQEQFKKFTENSVIEKTKKQLKSLNLILVEQNKLLFNTEDRAIIKLLAAQNSIFSQAIFSSNYQSSDDLRYSLSNQTIFKKQFEELSSLFPSYYFSVPYLVIYELHQIKKYMQKEDSSFDNKPEDIDSCLISLETQENIADSFNNLDQFTRSYLSEATYKYIKHFLI